MIPEFRAWDKYHGVMVKIVSIDFESKIAYVERKDGDRYDIHFDNLITMQSTDLKDKNRETYFQDDLVKYKNKVYRLVLGTYQFELVGFYNSYQDCPCDFFSEGAYLQAEIVGDIWENPELLEGE